MQQNDQQDQQEEENNYMQQNDQQHELEENNFMNQNVLVQNSKMHWIKKEIDLFPEGHIWTKRNVSCFINELDDFKKVPRRAYIQTFDDGIRTSIFHFVDHVYASIY